jgi:hypothetical protein
MRGSVAVPFSVLFADTVQTHGLFWAMMYYCEDHGMSAWEFSFWVRVLNLGSERL